MLEICLLPLVQEGKLQAQTVDDHAFAIEGLQPGRRNTFWQPIPSLFAWRHPAAGACTAMWTDVVLPAATTIP